MAEMARSYNTAVVEIGNNRRVDGGRKGEGVADEPVFVFGDKVGLPSQALDLPGSQCKGGNWDDCF